MTSASQFAVVENRKRRVSVYAERRRGTSRAAHHAVTLRRERQATKGVLGEFSKEVNKASQFIDKRIGERKRNLSREQKSILRLRKIRKKTTKSKFNLSEGETHGGGLTHGGIDLSELPDADIAGLKDREDSEDDEQIDAATTALHFGGGEEGDAHPDRKKTKKEVYQEIIVKSKIHKAQRAKERQTMEEEIEGLDADFRELQTDFNAIARPPRFSRAGIRFANEQAGENETDDYDKVVKSLSFEIKHSASERTKTAEELAKERAEHLHYLESQRIARTEGKEMSDDEDPNEPDNDDAASSVEDQDAPHTDDDDDEEEEEEQEEEEENADASSEAASDMSEVISVSDAEQLDVDQVITEIESAAAADEAAEENEVPLRDVRRPASEQKVVETPEQNNKMRQSEPSPGKRLIPEKESQKPTTTVEVLPPTFSEGTSAAPVSVDDDDDAPPEWLVNEPHESHLPFKLPCPSDYAEFTRLISRETPKAQWKLLHRLRAATEIALNPSEQSRLQRRKLTTYLLQYFLENLMPAGFPSAESSGNHSGIVEHIEEHVLFFVGENPDCAEQFCSPLLKNIALRSVTDLEGFANMTAKESSEGLPVSLLQQKGPTFADLGVLKLISRIYPLSDFRHRLVTPAAMLLDQWAAEISGMYRLVINPDGVHAGNSRDSYGALERYSNIAESMPHDPKALAKASCIFGLLYLYICEATRFSPSFFFLGAGMIHTFVTHLKQEDHDSDKLVLQALDTIQMLRNNLRQLAASVDAAFLPCRHLLLPTLERCLLLVGKNPNAKTLRTPLEDLKQFCDALVTQPLKPLQLHYSKPQGIRMLTPKYLSTTDPRLRHKGDMERSESRKIARENSKARRDLTKHIKRDAEVTAAVKWNESRLQNEKLERNYKKVISMLQQDQAEFKKMKTTGGTLDTSLKPYRPSKRIKKAARAEGRTR